MEVSLFATLSSFGPIRDVSFSVISSSRHCVWAATFIAFSAVSRSAKSKTSSFALLHSAYASSICFNDLSRVCQAMLLSRKCFVLLHIVSKTVCAFVRIISAFSAFLSHSARSFISDS